MIARFAAALTLLVLAGCAASPPQQALPEITFAHQPPIMLDVAEIRVEEEYLPPQRAPNVEHLMPVSPAATVHRWAADRLRPAGQSGVARVVVKDASVVAQDLERSGGIRSIFTTEQAVRYVANLVVEVDVTTAGGLGTGFATAAATRTVTAPEDISLNERDEILFELAAGLGRDIDQVLEANIRAHLGQFLR